MEIDYKNIKWYELDDAFGLVLKNHNWVVPFMSPIVGKRAKHLLGKQVFLKVAEEATRIGYSRAPTPNHGPIVALLPGRTTESVQKLARDHIFETMLK